MRQLSHFPDIGHAYGLSAGCIIGDCYNYARDLFCGIGLKYLFKFFKIDIAFEKMTGSCVTGFIDCAINCLSLSEFDMSFCSIKM